MHYMQCKCWIIIWPYGWNFWRSICFSFRFVYTAKHVACYFFFLHWFIITEWPVNCLTDCAIKKKIEIQYIASSHSPNWCEILRNETEIEIEFSLFVVFCVGKVNAINVFSCFTLLYFSKIKATTTTTTTNKTDSTHESHHDETASEFMYRCAVTSCFND